MSQFGPNIFRRDAAGNIRSWRYEVDGHRWRTIHGLLNGVKTETAWTSCQPRSRPTGEEQALFEAEAETGKKLERDYRVSVALVDVPRKAGPKPMLAHKHEPGAPWFGGHSQPKLDGMRCIATRDGLWTRQGKPIVSVPHVAAALVPWFAADPDLVLDGELYNHDLKDNFNELMSICRKQKPTEEDLVKAETSVQYHIYDIVHNELSFNSRFIRLTQLFEMKVLDKWPVGVLSLVPTAFVTKQEDLDRLYAQYLEDGYEGQMLRTDNGYENKRSKHLLKRKEFLSEEFEIVRIESGVGTWEGYGKRLIFKLKDGRECGAGVKGTQAFTKDLLDKASSLVGKQVTIKFFTPTPDGMPRFPVAIDFHLDENGRVD